MTALVEAVEVLTAKGYVVLTTEQAERVTALLGVIAFEDGSDQYGDEAEAILAEWPDSKEDKRGDE